MGSRKAGNAQDDSTGAFFRKFFRSILMIRFAWLWLGLFLLVVPAGMRGNGQTGNSPAPSASAAPSVPPASQVQPATPLPPTTYTLTPERRAKAIACPIQDKEQ